MDELKPRLVGMIVFGHQPSASTQQMAGAGETAGRSRPRIPSRRSSSPAGMCALPERTMHEEAVDFACNGEGP